MNITKNELDLTKNLLNLTEKELNGEKGEPTKSN